MTRGGAREDRSLRGFAAVVLAAGQSRRMNGVNKLTAQWQGRPLLSHVLETVCSLDLDQVVVVTGPPHGDDTRSVLRQHAQVTEVRNEFAGTGMGGSIAKGVQVLEPCAGVFICLGDMPLVHRQDFTDLRRALTGPVTMARMWSGGTPGHPVLFHSALRGRLAKLDGEGGAAIVFKETDPRKIADVQASHAGVAVDFDHRWW